MKLSQIDQNRMCDLNVAQKSEIVFLDCKDDGLHGDVALLLGSCPEFSAERAEAAAKLYLDGRVDYIAPSGGVEWEHDGEVLTEAAFMARILKEKGVPEEAIIMEEEARTTKENMICGTLQINRRLGLRNVKHVYIVTSARHMRRSLALAKVLLPRTLTFAGYPSWRGNDGSREHWFENEEQVKWVEKELYLLKELVDCHMIEDIEFSAGSEKI